MSLCLQPYTRETHKYSKHEGTALVLCCEITVFSQKGLLLERTEHEQHGGGKQDTEKIDDKMDELVDG